PCNHWYHHVYHQATGSGTPYRDICFFTSEVRKNKCKHERSTKSYYRNLYQLISHPIAYADLFIITWCYTSDVSERISVFFNNVVCKPCTHKGACTCSYAAKS